MNNSLEKDEDQSLRNRQIQDDYTEFNLRDKASCSIKGCLFSIVIWVVLSWIWVPMITTIKGCINIPLK